MSLGASKERIDGATDIMPRPERDFGQGGSLQQHARCVPSPHSASKTRVNALMLGEGWGGGWSDEARWCQLDGPPPLTPPHCTCRGDRGQVFGDIEDTVLASFNLVCRAVAVVGPVGLW